MDNTAFESPASVIVVATPVPYSQSQGFLYHQLGLDWLRFEYGAYQALQEASHGYEGGLWDFYSLSNGGFYMAPTGCPALRMQGPGNGFDSVLSADAAGIYATAMALSHLSFQSHSDLPAQKFHLLRDFYVLHPEASILFSALD